MTSRHYQLDRELREEVIEFIGYGKIIKTIEIDRGHRNGAEIHELSDTGIINIYNKRTHKLITKLIASPGQVRRCYQESEIVPQFLLNLARAHKPLAAMTCAQRIEQILYFFCTLNRTYIRTVSVLERMYS